MKSPTAFVLFIFALFAIAGLATACQPQDTPPIASETPVQETPTRLPIDATPSADEARDVIANALLALYTRPNRMDVTTVLGSGETRTNSIEFIPPDRKRIVDPLENVEYVVIGEKVYAKTSGVWAETQIPASTFMGKEVDLEIIKETIADAQWVRQDVLDGTPVFIYRYNSTTKPSDIELHSQTELWVGEADGLPYQMIVDGEILAASTDPGTGESKLQAVKALTTTLISFANIEIEAPVK